LKRGLKTLLLIILAYAPSILLPVIDHQYSRSNAYATWFYITIWGVYILILLIAYYIIEKRESG